jgi:hypothetical protein
MSGESLIDTIIHYFEYHVMKASTVISVTDIHPWPLADGFQAF